MWYSAKFQNKIAVVMGFFAGVVWCEAIIVELMDVLYACVGFWLIFSGSVFVFYAVCFVLDWYGFLLGFGGLLGVAVAVVMMVVRSGICSGLSAVLGL